MSNPERFLQLEKELKPYRKMMADAAAIVREKDVSEFPIFVAHQQEMEIGIALTEGKNDGKWSIHASTLEEFVSKQIIFPEKIEEFKSNYKDPEKTICVFALSELGAQFLFLAKP